MAGQAKHPFGLGPRADVMRQAPQPAEPAGLDPTPGRVLLESLLFGASSSVIFVQAADGVGASDAATEEWWRQVSDGVNLADAVAYAWGPSVADTINMSDAGAASATLLALTADSVVLADAVVLAWSAAVADTITGADSAAGLRTALAIVADAIRAADAGTSQLQALTAVIAGVALADQAGPGYVAVAADTVNLTETMVATATLLANLADTVTVADGAVGAIRVTALIEDGAGVDDSVDTQLTAFAAVADGLRVAATVRINDAVYYAYVLHPQPVDRAGTRPVSQYQNFNFNSFANSPRKRQYAAGPGGIFRLEGADDDGTPIDWRMTTALTNFGADRRKRLPEMWLALRADDEAVYLKVRHIDLETGRKVEDWYDLEPGPPDGDGLRNNQVRLQQGLKAVWWQATLTNRAGAPADIASLTFHPVILDRS